MGGKILIGTNLEMDIDILTLYGTQDHSSGIRELVAMPVSFSLLVMLSVLISIERTFLYSKAKHVALILVTCDLTLENVH